jgi:hypothetical protein
MKHTLTTSALLLTVACSGSLSTPSPNTGAQTNLLGTWTVEFRLDSVRSQGWHAGSFATTRGTLQLSDSTSPNVFHSQIDVAFDALLGRPMSCFSPRPTTTGVSREGDRVSLSFTPSAADCGFGASGLLSGDSIVGTWDETSFVGPVVMGRFRMVRVKQ